MFTKSIFFAGKYIFSPPGTIFPGGKNANNLKIQLQGLTGNHHKSGYPFDTPMWNGGVGIIKSAPIIHNDEETPSPDQDAWWPYEQSAYLLDGILKTAILMNQKEGIELFEQNLFYLISHPSEDGRLGEIYQCDIHWPMAPFFRAALAYAEYTNNTVVKNAFIKHYQALTVEDIGIGFRHINNIEGLLTTYSWSNDQNLLSKAQKAYNLHNQFYSSNPQGIRELYFDKIRSMEKHILHGVTFSEGIKLPVLLYMYTGNKEYLQAAEYALNAVLQRHGTLTSLPSSNEFFTGNDPLQGYESCLINDYTWALGIFFQATGNVKYADDIEKIIYNALGGATTKDFTSLMYISAPNQVIAAPESNHAFFYRGSEDVMQFRPNHSAQCCPGNIHHALPNFIMRQFMYQNDNTPVAVLYGAATWNGKYNNHNFTIIEDTHYPYDDKITFKISSNTSFPFAIRIPIWCTDAKLKINNKNVTTKLIPGTIFTIKEVNDKDIIKLTLPMKVIEKHDRHWMWYEAGPIIYSLPIDYHESFEYDNIFAPRSYYPTSEWNYSPIANTAKLKRKDNYSTLSLKATKVTNFDSLEQGRFTPQVPLICERFGNKKTLTLIPYCDAKLRITAFPDGIKRKMLFTYQALITEAFPYDEKIPLDKQIYTPENLDKQDFILQSNEIFPEKDGSYDLLHFFGKLDNKLCYLSIRFWSDIDQEAYFCVSASTAAICWVNTVKCLELLPGSEHIFTTGLWFNSPVKKGFNILLCKVAKGICYEQYRNSWGVKAEIFIK